MRSLAGGLILSTLLILGPGRALSGKADEGPAGSLVQQLGSRKYAEREAAARKLEALGEASLPALKRAVRNADLEVRRRADLLIDRIERTAQATRLLAGKRVRLVYKATPILDAIDDLASRTGLDVRIEGEAADLHGRTLTLDTGATTAWEALVQFCRKAGLAELPPPASPTDDFPDGAVRLTDVSVRPLPTYLAGALRLRALPARAAAGVAGPAGGFVLEASPEPGLPWHGVVGVRILRAVDERGEELTPTGPTEPAPLPDRPKIWDAVSGQPLLRADDRRRVSVWLAAARQTAARLKEVRGVLTVQVPVVRELLTVNDVLRAEGKTFDDAHGRFVKVLRVARTAAALTLRVQVKPHGPSGAGAVPFQVMRTPKGVLIVRGSQREPLVSFALEDAAGAALRPESSRQTILPNRGGGLVLEFEVNFPLQAGQEPPDRLVCRGPRLTGIDIPFTLRDVPLTSAPAPASPTDARLRP